MGTVICVSINLFNCLMCTKELIVVVTTKQLVFYQNEPG